MILLFLSRGVLQGDFITALGRIFRMHDSGASGVCLTADIRLGNLEFAEDVGLLDETANAATEKITRLRARAENEGGLKISVPKIFAQHVKIRKR